MKRAGFHVILALSVCAIGCSDQSESGDSPLGKTQSKIERQHEGSVPQARTQQAALRTYYHGMTATIARMHVGPEGLPDWSPC